MTDVPASPRLKVLYIVGYGRSGTTVFDIALGQSQLVFGGGEIANFTEHVWANNEHCACGYPVHDCPFWTSVIKQWSLAEEGSSPIGRYRDLQELVESNVGLVRALLRRGTDKDWREYASLTSSFFRAIALVSGCILIVDSSKAPSRAFALAQIDDIDLHVVHLVRDGRAVAWSMLKGYKRNMRAGLQRNIQPKSMMRTATRWCLVNLASEVLCRRLGRKRYVRVKYEEFAADPPSSLRQVERLVELDFADVKTALRHGKTITPMHQVAGNRLRMKKEITLVQDDRWRIEMPARKTATFKLFYGWMLRRYGYR